MDRLHVGLLACGFSSGDEEMEVCVCAAVLCNALYRTALLHTALYCTALYRTACPHVLHFTL